MFHPVNMICLMVSVKLNSVKRTEVKDESEEDEVRAKVGMHP